LGYNEKQKGITVNNVVKSVKLCFGISCNLLPGLDSEAYETQYETIYKPLISTLYTLPELPFTIYISGTLIDWMEQHHTEFFMILEEMFSRKQIEILGGGYYSPLFPLIPAADRVGQLELLTTVLRKYFGKRPRGAWLTSSAWEPSLVSSLCSCGIEYVLLDKLLLETSGANGVDGFSPVTLEDNGKTITAVPVDNRYRNLGQFSPADFLGEIGSYVRHDQERIVVVFLDQSAAAQLFPPDDESSSWFASFLDLLKTREFGIELSTIGRYLKNKTLYRRAYISSGMSPCDLEDMSAQENVKILARTSIKHALLKSSSIMNLYAKMMYVHILVNQLRGDKSRKKNAREELWRAQNSDVYRTPNAKDSAVSRSLRTLTYKNLLVAEKATRLRGVFSPSIITFDFDLDGLKEYLCQLESLNMYVHSYGGKIFEFDIFKVYRNYCDLSLPTSGLFIDHFIGQDDIAQIKKGNLQSVRPVFSETLYQDVAVDPARHEINLKANGLFGSFQQPVTLRKQYTFRNEGIQVQYILKNDSPLNLSGVFMIELDLSLAETRRMVPGLTVYAHDARQETSVDTGHYDDVSWLLIDDREAGVKFTLDTNENPSVSIFPILWKGKNATEPINMLEGVRIFLYWKVDLGPNYEMEKMAFLKIDA
jgi:hypothetical protein